MTLEEFAQKYCFACGSQRCTGVDSEFANGCLYYNTVFLNREEELYNACIPHLNKAIEERLSEILRRQ